MLRTIILLGARRFKGETYSIDEDIPERALIGFASRRALALLRSVFRGLVFSLNPKKHVFLGAGVELRNRNLIKFGKGVTIGKYATIDGLSRCGVSIGDNVTLGPYTIIEATGVISHIGKGVSIGRNSGIGAFSFIGAAGGVTIGENVIMGQRVTFHAENHVFKDCTVPIRLQGVTHQGIVVGDDCWIGANVAILDGANIGKGCVIAAGAVVRGEIPSYSVAAGVPARVIKKRNNE